MKQASKITLIVVFLNFILGLGIDLYTPSFPAMQKAFNTTEQLIQLSITIYFFGNFIGLLILGPISDALGRKKPLVILLIYYTVICVLVVFSTNIYSLLTYRFLQGLGIAIVGISFRSILSDIFSGKDLAKALSYASMSYRLSPVIAPFFGGYLEVFFGWQSNFIFLAAYALFVVYLTSFHLTETHLEKIPFHPHLLLRRYGQILKNKVFLGAAVCVGLQYGLILVFNLVAPFFLSKVLGYSPITYGHIAFIVGGFAFLGILCNRILLRWTSYLTLIQLGIYAIVGLSFLFAIFTWIFPTNLWSLILPLFAILFFTGFLSANMIGHALNLIPRGKGTASALQAVIVIFISVALTFFSSFLKTTSSFPLAIYYLGIALCTLLGYQLLFRRN